MATGQGWIFARFLFLVFRRYRIHAEIILYLERTYRHGLKMASKTDFLHCCLGLKDRITSDGTFVSMGGAALFSGIVSGGPKSYQGKRKSEALKYSMLNIDLGINPEDLLFITKFVWG